MSLDERLLAQLRRTERRFRQRKETRQATTRSLKHRDYIGANEKTILERRLRHLNMAPDQAARVGTRSFAIPSRTESTPPGEAIENVTLERILGDNDLMPISYLALGLWRARSVGRIHIRSASGVGRGYGTGFLVSPSLLLTNNHVLETASESGFSKVEFDFEADLTGRVRETITFDLDPRTFFLTDEELDFTLVAVSPNGDRLPRDWGWHRLPEQDGLVVKGEFVSIIQHPNGEAKQLALRENRVIDLLDDFAHYQTDTAPGSSGSPVFNDQWEMVALHHSGVPERFNNGDIKTIDGRKWERWMGDHRIKWIANEGVSGIKIVGYIKNARGLSSAQKQLRDELFDAEPPAPDVPVPGVAVPVSGAAPPRPVAETGAPPPVSLGPATGAPDSGCGGVTRTIPLQVTVSLGNAPAASLAHAAPPLDLPPAAPPQSPEPPAMQPPEQDEDLNRALAELEAGRTRRYFDAEADAEDRDRYYASIDAGDLSGKALFRQLGKLLKSTHRNKPKYKPSLHVYPWVDLHPDRKLRSVYSGKSFDAEELIREDVRIERERAHLLQEFIRRETDVSAKRLQEEVDLFEARNPFNCEHVVPQSWYRKKEPMRGDLHHLFACESGCNSFRGNIPYFEFTDFDEAVRLACGKREADKFEPAAGKGPAARATLYFLLRYPGKVNSPDEFPAERIRTLLEWHAAEPVDEYERHRNQAIFAIQGNRNPLIDFPEWAETIKFELGLA